MSKRNCIFLLFIYLFIFVKNRQKCDQSVCVWSHTDSEDIYPWDFKTQSSLNIYLNLQSKHISYHNWICIYKGWSNEMYFYTSWGSSRLKFPIFSRIVISCEPSVLKYLKFLLNECLCPLYFKFFHISTFECCANLTLIAGTKGMTFREGLTSHFRRVGLDSRFQCTFRIG